jgi:molybdate transport system substrate-binding protein
VHIHRFLFATLAENTPNPPVIATASPPVLLSRPQRQFGFLQRLYCIHDVGVYKIHLNRTQLSSFASSLGPPTFREILVTEKTSRIIQSTPGAAIQLGETVRLKHMAGGIQSRLCGCVALLALTASISACHAPDRVTLTLSVAASLKDAIAETEAAYRQSHANIYLSNNFGSSGTLAGQIEQGAPADMFLSAGAKPMDELEGKGLIAAGTRRNLLRNSLVLIAPLDSRLIDFDGLTGSSVRLIALGDLASVPAGQYGQQTLLSLHLWDKLNAKLVLGKDVRQVLTYVETGNADAGLVYATDALTSSKVRVVASAPESAHDPIVYPAAVVKGSRSEEAARRFIDYLASPAAQAIFQKHGFTMATP